MFTLAFWKAAFERAVKTAAQTVLTVYLVGDVAFDVFAADWQGLVGVAVGGAFLSVVTSLASSLKGDSDSPSLANEVTIAHVPKHRAFADPDDLDYG